jgi:hypothetical protein
VVRVRVEIDMEVDDDVDVVMLMRYAMQRIANKVHKDVETFLHNATVVVITKEKIVIEGL